MTTQYTTILKLALPVQGELSGTWGDVVNDNITSMVEEAVAGRKVINTWTANSHTLTSADGTTSESRAAILTLTDTGTALTGAGTVVCPALSKVYIVENSTAQVITIKTSGGTGIAVPVGRNMVVFCDGTNVEEGISNIASLSIGGDGATVTGIKDEDDMSSNSATKLATQQSIKAYVDSQVGANNELSEVLANGNTSGANDIIVDNGQKITVNTIDETTADSGVAIDSVLLKDDGVNATNLEVTNIKANDGTAAGSIADSTGVVTVASAVLTTADINGGTADGVVIGGTTPAAATVTTATANTSLNIAGTVTVTSILDEDNMASDDPAGLATQQSIKAYVDSQVGANNELSEVLANGNTTGGTDIAVGTGDDITFADSSKAIFGADSDLAVYHNGSNGFVENETGLLILKNNSDDRDVAIQSDDGSGGVTNYLLADGSTGALNAYHYGSLKLATTATGIDVTGTLTADGLTVTGTLGNFAVDTQGAIVTLSRPSTSYIRASDVSGSLRFDTGGSVARLNIANNGDISFYEDTGTTPKLFWDASAEGLAIGDGGSGIEGLLDLQKTDNTVYSSTSRGNGFLQITNASSTSGVFAGLELIATGTGSAGAAEILCIDSGSGSGDLAFSTRSGGTWGEKVRILAGGNVGIGESNPQELLHLTATTPVFRMQGGSRTYQQFVSGTDFVIRDVSAGINRVTLDSSGNLLVGTTDSSIETSSSGEGVNIFPNKISVARNGVTANFNRLSDGDIVKFRKDGLTVGSIGAVGGDVVIHSSGASHAGLRFAINAYLPTDNTGAVVDSTTDLGTSAFRYKDLYLSGGVKNVTPSGVATSTIISAISGVTNGFEISANTSNQITYDFNTGAGLKMRLTNDGNLLAGASSLADVNGLVTNHLFEGANSTAGYGAVGVYNNTGTANAPALVVLNRDTSTNSTNRFVQFYANVSSSTSTSMGGIIGNGAGNVQFVSISDVREKENITTISGSLSKINSLNPVEFDWIASGEHCKAGFVAQEVEAVFPEFVVENMASEGQEERKGLTGGMTGGIVAHLVKAIQEQQETITALTARITQLENN